MPRTTTPMSVRRLDFEREVVLDCDKDGTVTIRNRGDRVPEGSLPFFSVDTVVDAEALIVRLCKLQYALHPRTLGPHYRFTEFGNEMSLTDIDSLADRFRSAWLDLHERRILEQGR
jgi:hypothetical protein